MVCMNKLFNIDNLKENICQQTAASLANMLYLSFLSIQSSCAGVAAYSILCDRMQFHKDWSVYMYLQPLITIGG
jgi:hypothetical protein